MFCPRRFAVMLAAAFLAALIPAASFSQDAGQSPQAECAKLVGVLQSDAPLYDKAMACRRLAVVGDKDAAQALAPLVADEKLATYARSALEMMPATEADVVLREAAGKVQGDLLVGVLVSIGKRRDAKSVETLAKLLSAGDSKVAAASARALGHVGTAEAADVLKGALAEASAELRPVVATAGLIAVGRLLEDKNTDAAIAMCDAVREADVPQHIVLAATRRAIAAQGRSGVVLLAEELGAEDEARFRFALEAARDLGADACGPLAEQFKKATASRQALLILALADIGDKSVLPMILEAARSGASQVRVEAIAALAVFGDPTAASVLLQGAIDSDADVAAAAREALSALDSPGVDPAIVKMLDSDDPKTLLVAVELAGDRGIDSAGPAILKLAGNTDGAVRQAAIASLGSTVSLDALPKLIAMAMSGGSDVEQAAASDALKAACARLPREACAEKLSAAMKGAPTETQVALIEQLSVVGGPTALDTVTAAARSDDDALQDAATKALGGWMTADVAPKLLALSESLASQKYKIRCLRGYIRVARQLDMSSAERVEVCRKAIEIADRRDEKVLALDTLGRVDSSKSLAAAVGYLDDADLKEPAARAVVAISEKLLATSPDEAKAALERVIAVTANSQTAETAKSLMARLAAQ